jgi:CRP/FNR family cyclic AMP-dependent transcriptional regulator
MPLFTSDQKIDLLKKVPMFNELSNRHLKEICKHSDKVAKKAGDVLVRQGDKGWEFFFIIEGKARVEKDGRVIRNLTSGGFFGEISLIDREPRTASVIAETDMELLVVHSRSFSHLLNTTPGLSGKILISLCKYLRRAEKDINL